MVTLFLLTVTGVGFRFEDIRSLFYTEFLKHNDGTNTLHPMIDSNYYTGESGDDVPDIHNLTQNFRTHSGVCNIASSIVDLCVYFFPNSIDKLKKEQGTPSWVLLAY